MTNISSVLLAGAVIGSTFAAGVDAGNTFRVETIFRFPIGDAVTCEDAWARLPGERSAQAFAPGGDQRLPPPGVIMRKDGDFCVATRFSRHFEAPCTTGTLCGDRACVAVERSWRKLASPMKGAKPGQISFARPRTRGLGGCP